MISLSGCSSYTSGDKAVWLNSQWACRAVFLCVCISERERERGSSCVGGCCRVKLRLNPCTGRQLLHIANPWNNVKIVCLGRFGQERRSPNLSGRCQSELSATGNTRWGNSSPRVASAAVLPRSDPEGYFQKSLKEDWKFPPPTLCLRDAAHDGSRAPVTDVILHGYRGIKVGAIADPKESKDLKEVWHYSSTWLTTSQLPSRPIGRSTLLCFCHLFTQACVMDPSCVGYVEKKKERNTSRPGDYHPSQLAHMCLWAYI